MIADGILRSLVEIITEMACARERSLEIRTLTEKDSKTKKCNQELTRWILKHWPLLEDDALKNDV